RFRGGGHGRQQHRGGPGPECEALPGAFHRRLNVRGSAVGRGHATCGPEQRHAVSAGGVVVSAGGVVVSAACVAVSAGYVAASAVCEPCGRDQGSGGTASSFAPPKSTDEYERNLVSRW